MELQKLFDAQAHLDGIVLQNHPIQEGEDRLTKKFMALYVELGNCLSEWRGHMFWSKNQRANTEVYGVKLNGNYAVKDPENKRNPHLEKYVDCLHLIISIGLEYKYVPGNFEFVHESNFKLYTEQEALQQYKNLFLAVSGFCNYDYLEEYENIFLYFIGLSFLHGFDWLEVEKIYYKRNQAFLKQQEKFHK